jgi:hypothetical protein
VTVVVPSGFFADIATTDCGVDSKGFEEYVGSSCLAAKREEA